MNELDLRPVDGICKFPTCGRPYLSTGTGLCWNDLKACLHAIGSQPYEEARDAWLRVEQAREEER